MTIAIGHILDRYELQEKVGQGGMAVVYRGLDQSLRRTVAIKVLHRHLADHQEARERFEREAQAVAKLHHENILEIFDFSGSDSDESYIVTEFIDGQTLKEFVSAYQPKYPEIGAMIAMQVCRALDHAHGLGILHRDVKPENIMIRSDGVVKLTDFGIAQMLDMQRMTVTGQLIGSPAYMSPEHLEGKRLDFRTDVFAVGVVLYQLVTGELPFQGRNPHEILKRIADGTYKDSRQVNPLIGNELGRIIDKAMARDADARYADISEMLGALERYLEKSGIRSCREELARYFAAPVSYEIALRERLLAELSRRGREILATDQVAALDLFNRVLTIEPGHKEVLAHLERLSRRKRAARLLVLFGSILVVAAVVWGARLMLRGNTSLSGNGLSVSSARAGGKHAAAGPAPRAPDRPLPVETTAPAGPTGPAAPADDAGDAASAAAPVYDAAIEEASQQRPKEPAEPTVRLNPGQRPSGLDPRPMQPDDEPERPPAQRVFTLNVWPLKSEYRIDDQPWVLIPENRAILRVGPGAHSVEVRNPQCCQPLEREITAAEPGGIISVSLGYLPATITPKCKVPGVRVQINQKPARLDHKTPIPISGGLARQDVTIMFFGERTDKQQIQVRYNESKVVTCAFQ